MLLLKCWYTSHYPKTFRSSVGTLHTVPRHFVLVLGHFTLSQHLVLGHLALSQDLILKCWDTSHCPKTTNSSVGTLRSAPRSFVLVLEQFTLSQDLVLRHLALFQDLILKCWTLRTVPRPFHSSVGTSRTVPRPPTQALGHFALPQDPSS